MFYSVERARDSIVTAEELVCRSFGSELLQGDIDAEYLSADRARVVGAAGLSYKAPVCIKLLNHPALHDFIFAAPSDKQLFVFGYDVKYYDETGEKELPDDLAAIAMGLFNRAMASRGVINENGEQVLDLKTSPVGPHFNVNLLIGNRAGYPEPLLTTPKSAVDSLGRGSFRSGGSQQVLATRCVLQPEENGEPANRQFYIVENNKRIFYSLDTETNVASARCVHSQNSTVITYVTECGLEITRTIFILPQEDGMPEAVEAQRVAIRNLTDRERELRIVMTGMFGITGPETIANDVVYANIVVETERLSRNGRPAVMSMHFKPNHQQGEKRFAMLLSDGETMDDYCTSLSEFIGNGSLAYPDMLSAMPSRHNRRFAPFFAMGKSFTLASGETRNVDGFVGMMTIENDDPDAVYDAAVGKLFEKYSSDSALADALAEVKNFWNRYSSYITPHTGNDMFDSYVGRNLPFQVLYQTFVSRAFAWTQKSYRETGFREIQDIFASMYYMAANGMSWLAKDLISNWVRNVFRMGYANHNFTRAGKEPGDCSDDQIWLAQAVYRYVKLTGDYDYLLEEYEIAGESGKRTLWDTLMAILEYSGEISVGKNGLPLLDKADWNDTLRLDKLCMDGPTKERVYREQLERNGQEYGAPLENSLSESVMNACLLKIAADAVAEMGEHIGKQADAARAAELSRKLYDSMQKNCWKGDFFARAMINDDRDYTYLGAGGDNLSADPSIDGTYFLNSFSWTILAGVATDEQIATMLGVVNKYLRCDAGLKLCTLVHYELLGANTATSLYFAGDRENGGVFKHAAMMATTAALKAAKTVADEKLAEDLAELAFFMIDKTLPYTTMKAPYITKGNPRFCTQYNNSETGENIGPILSGTASWLSLAIFEQLGLDIGADGAVFSPVLPRGSSGIGYTLDLEGTVITVDIKRGASWRATEQTQYIYDGTKQSKKIPVVRDGGRHTLEIIL